MSKNFILIIRRNGRGHGVVHSEMFSTRHDAEDCAIRLCKPRTSSKGEDEVNIEYIEPDYVTISDLITRRGLHHFKPVPMSPKIKGIPVCEHCGKTYRDGNHV